MSNAITSARKILRGTRTGARNRYKSLSECERSRWWENNSRAEAGAGDMEDIVRVDQWSSQNQIIYLKQKRANSLLAYHDFDIWPLLSLLPQPKLGPRQSTSCWPGQAILQQVIFNVQLWAWAQLCQRCHLAPARHSLYLCWCRMFRFHVTGF